MEKDNWKTDPEWKEVVVELKSLSNILNSDIGNRDQDVEEYERKHNKNEEIEA